MDLNDPGVQGRFVTGFAGMRGRLMQAQRFRALALVVTMTAAALTACSSDESKTKASPTCPPGNPKPSRTVAWSSIYANVYNASDAKGEGAKVAERLSWRGLHTLDVSNDPKADDRPTPKYAEIRYGKAGRTNALNVAAQVPHASLHEDDRTDPTIDVVIGNAFSLQAEAPRPIKDVTVHVYNTTFFGGLAAKVSGELTKQEFKSDAQPNDKAYYPNDTAVIVYDEQGLPDAQRLQMSIKGARLLQDTQTNGNVDIKGREVRLYLGSKWPDGGAVLPLKQASASPSATPSKPGC